MIRSETARGQTPGILQNVRICLVTPFAWSQPHEVNDHVGGVAAALRGRGHEVTVVAPSTRAADLLAGRRALAAGSRPDVIAVGAAVPVSRRSQLGVPVGVQANLRQALALGFDVVHGFEPGLPSLSYLALRDADALTVATFVSPNRLGYPPARSAREKLLARVDALIALNDDVRQAAEQRFPGDYRLLSPGVDLGLFHPQPKQRLIVHELRPNERIVARSVMRTLRELPDWELVLLRTRPLIARPAIPRDLAARVHVRTARDQESRAALLGAAAIFVPGLLGVRRVTLEAAAAGCAIGRPKGVESQPELAAAATARLAEDTALREREAEKARERAAGQTFDAVATELDELYGSLASRRRPRRRHGDPLAGRPWIVADLHMHTSWSHDCSTDPAELVDHAEAEGLGAIAVTDHNVFGGALEAADYARGRDLVVIPGEEVKTDEQGEVIGLFLQKEIPRGLSFADTIAAIREQDGIVYVPHPFDRLHAIPDPRTLHRHLADVDVLEVYNARLLFEAFNDEALRFARKYDLTMGAGSDAHVLQGVGTGAVRMRAFAGPEEFLLSLRAAEVLRRPKPLAYLQSLKWVAQVKERVR
jgi:predicted metal-dependent phosphoesterase TrpH/glycosyltransferase involved in cell wall biosynthesis